MCSLLVLLVGTFQPSEQPPKGALKWGAAPFIFKIVITQRVAINGWLGENQRRRLNCMRARKSLPMVKCEMLDVETVNEDWLRMSFVLWVRLSKKWSTQHKKHFPCYWMSWQWLRLLGGFLLLFDKKRADDAKGAKAIHVSYELSRASTFSSAIIDEFDCFPPQLVVVLSTKLDAANKSRNAMTTTPGTLELSHKYPEKKAWTSAIFVNCLFMSQTITHELPTSKLILNKLLRFLVEAISMKMASETTTD
jgi:hypothetical protein